MGQQGLTQHSRAPSGSVLHRLVVGRWLLRRLGFISSLVAILTLLFVTFYLLFWAWGGELTSDWRGAIYPALHADNPYAAGYYFNPPWLLWLLAPLKLLTLHDSFILWISIVTLLTMRTVRALGGGTLALVLTLTSPGMIETLLNGQVDVLVLLGLLTGSWFLILIKPQVAGTAVLYDVVRRRRIDWLSIGVMLVSLFTSGWWITRTMVGSPLELANLAPFPYGIPLGVVLFALALARRDYWLAVLASPFLAPYISGNSLMVYSAIVTSRYSKPVAITFSAGIWLLTLLRFM